MDYRDTTAGTTSRRRPPFDTCLLAVFFRFGPLTPSERSGNLIAGDARKKGFQFRTTSSDITARHVSDGSRWGPSSVEAMRFNAARAKRFTTETGSGVKHAADTHGQVVLEEGAAGAAGDAAERPSSSVIPMARQTGSLFEPSTEAIRKGKAGSTEFCKMVKLQKADKQIVIDYEVYGQRPTLGRVDCCGIKHGWNPRTRRPRMPLCTAKNAAAASSSAPALASALPARLWTEARDMVRSCRTAHMLSRSGRPPLRPPSPRLEQNDVRAGHASPRLPQ